MNKIFSGHNSEELWYKIELLAKSNPELYYLLHELGLMLQQLEDKVDKHEHQKRVYK